MSLNFITDTKPREVFLQLGFILILYLKFIHVDIFYSSSLILISIWNTFIHQIYFSISWLMEFRLLSNNFRLLCCTYTTCRDEHFQSVSRCSQVNASPATQGDVRSHFTGRVTREPENLFYIISVRLRFLFRRKTVNIFPFFHTLYVLYVFWFWLTQNSVCYKSLLPAHGLVFPHCLYCLSHS